MVVHSATKYLGGMLIRWAGIVVSRDEMDSSRSSA
jgi:O-acetylhomoserine/O-acetylserine sulfhydrylase-like pyridoxal-dependent enzyme